MMFIESLQEPAEDSARSAAHAAGYLLTIAALPWLAAALPFRRNMLLVLLILAVVIMARQYLVVAVRDALSAGRAKAVLGWVDLAALFIGLASTHTVQAYDSLLRHDGWGACLAVWALAALGCSARFLTRATKTWCSSTFVSTFGDRQQSRAVHRPDA
jgi:predicted membrane channel-forming protein YqfA (hemolysin III family)